MQPRRWIRRAEAGSEESRGNERSKKIMPKGGIEPPRAKPLTWPSTMRVYQIPPLRHPELGALLFVTEVDVCNKI